jgi:multidrug resistance efflux pump
MGHSAADEREAAERVAKAHDPLAIALKEVERLKAALWQSQHQHQFFIAEREAARAERDRLRNEFDRSVLIAQECGVRWTLEYDDGFADEARVQRILNAGRKR